MRPTEEDVALLRDLRSQGKLIPFVGSGLSRPLNLPSWKGLIDRIADELGYDRKVFAVHGSDWQLAEYYVAMKGSIGPLRSLMDKQFDPDDALIRESRSHRALVAMGLPLVYTTNYDRIIERAFELHGSGCHVVSNIDDMASAPPGVTQVVKFHGTFDDDASLVLTESSFFERLEFEHALDIRLRADMLGRSLLFLGYSLTDINIRYLLHKLHKLRSRGARAGKRNPSAFLATFGTGEIQRTLLERWDVAIIELDPVDMAGSMARFLEALA